MSLYSVCPEEAGGFKVILSLKFSRWLAAEWTGVSARVADGESRSCGRKLADPGRRGGFQTSCCMHLHWNLEDNQSESLKKVSPNVTDGLQRKHRGPGAVLFLFH